MSSYLLSLQLLPPSSFEQKVSFAMHKFFWPSGKEGLCCPLLSNIYNLEHISVPFEKQHVCPPSPRTHWATRKTFTWCLTKILPGHWMPSCKTAASNSFDISMNCDVILRCVQLRAAQWSIPSESLQNLYWEKLLHLLPSFQILREINI